MLLKLVLLLTNRSVKKFMSPRTPEQNEQIRKERISEILAAALYTFSKNGYHASSIAAIAKKAGVSKGLMYNYFESKEEVLKVLLTDLFESVIKTMELNETPFTDERLIRFIEDTFSIVGSNRAYWKLYFSLVVQPEVTDISKELMLPKIIPFIESLTRYFAEKGHENPTAYLRYFLASLDGAKIQYLLDEENFQLHTIKTYLINEFTRDVSN